MTIPDELRPFVNDYRVNLFEISYLDDEQVEMFTSDFRIVADYFVQIRKNHNYVPSAVTITHVDAVLKLMAVMTQDWRFEEALDQAEGGEPRNMCEVLDRVENMGIEKGKAEGKAEGTDLVNRLNRILLDENRLDDLEHSVRDASYQKQLMKEYKLI